MKNIFRKNNFKKKMFLMALATTIATPSIIQTVEVEAASSTFKDIPTNFVHSSKIDTLVSKGVISGYTDGTFRPSEKVNRGQFALFISRALNLPLPSTPQAFKDVGKNSAVYDGVVKAQAAGIINGYTDGSFKPSELITRNDMAIMLDRALQYKASYPNKSTLSYSDKGSIGKSAVTAVERLTHYKIMSAFTKTSFSPNTTGDRISTVLSIYELMVTKNLISNDSPQNGYPQGDIRNYSYDELVDILGEWKVLKRAYPDGAITEIDVVAEMRNDFMNLPDGVPALKVTPQKFFQTYRNAFDEAPSLYSSYYPLVEYVAINGVPYRNTEYYPAFFANPEFISEITLNNVIPNPPQTDGEFLIDLPSKNKDVVTYKNGQVNIERMGAVVKSVANHDYLVDVKALFKDTSLVSVSSDGLTIQYGEQTVTLQTGSNKASVNGQMVILPSSVVSENGMVLVPFKAVADQLGLYWREMFNAKRFEIANYPLEKGILGWEE